MAIGKITLRNYRCFDWANPAILEFGDGFTAFVGPNNSGKSSALRAIYELRVLWGSVYSSFYQGTTVGLQGVSDYSEIANDKDPSKVEITIEIDRSLPASNPAYSQAVEVVLEYNVATTVLRPIRLTMINAGGAEITLQNQQLQTQQLDTVLLRFNDQGRSTAEFAAIIEFMTDLTNSKYYPAFRNAINVGGGSYYDLPIGTALVETWDSWKAGDVRAHKVAISKVEAQIAELLGFSSLEINADKSGKTLDISINRKPHKLYEVGAGVAQLIITLASALVNKPAYLLIDEPESNLHPALQLNFLTTLGAYTQKGILFSTHSLGLARSSAQRIYSVQREDGISKMTPFGNRVINFSEWLGELSYSSRVELGCEGVILVEGPSEVLCFQEFLRKLGKESRFAILSMGGSSLINANIAPHLEEIKRLVDPNNIHIFIDSERNSATADMDDAHQSFISECDKLGVRAFASELRATENYFTAAAIQAALGPSFQQLGPYERLRESVKPWRKSDNWKIVKELTIKDIQDTDLGAFLKAL